jgi:hypothetical protein
MQPKPFEPPAYEPFEPSWQLEHAVCETRELFAYLIGQGVAEPLAVAMAAAYFPGALMGMPSDATVTRRRESEANRHLRATPEQLLDAIQPGWRSLRD